MEHPILLNLNFKFHVTFISIYICSYVCDLCSYFNIQVHITENLSEVTENCSRLLCAASHPLFYLLFKLHPKYVTLLFCFPEFHYLP